MYPWWPFGTGEVNPYSNFHDLNQDWIIRIAKDFLNQYTHIQEIISTGEESIQHLSEESLTAIQNTADEISNLLQTWYDTHSADIANQLANAISTFNASADAKALATIASIPDDYTELAKNVQALKTNIDDTINAYPLPTTPVLSRMEVLFARYSYKNNIMTRSLAIRITTDDFSAADEYSLGRVDGPLIVDVQPHCPGITYTAVAQNGADMSDFTFTQNVYQSGSNLMVRTTRALPRGYGDIIYLTNEQPFLNTDTIIPTDNDNLDTEFMFKYSLFNPEFYTQDYSWNAINSTLGYYSGWSYTQVRVIPNTSVIINGLSQSASTLGYGIRSTQGAVLTSGSIYDGMTIDIPDDGCYLIFSFPTADAATLKITPFIKRKIVVLGDSWADTDPEHTTYTKWPALLDNDNRFKCVVYAQNGATISGDSPNSGLNGNVLGLVR